MKEIEQLRIENMVLTAALQALLSRPPLAPMEDLRKRLQLAQECLSIAVEDGRGSPAQREYLFSLVERLVQKLDQALPLRS